jgi:hypothetical protein
MPLSNIIDQKHFSKLFAISENIFACDGLKADKIA